MDAVFAFFADAWAYLALGLIGLVVLGGILLFLFSSVLFEQAGDKGLQRLFRRRSAR